MIVQNARYFKRRRRRAQGVGDQLSDSDDPDGDEPEDPDDRGVRWSPPGRGPPGGAPPCVKLLAGVPPTLYRKHVRRARALLDWQRDGDHSQDPPDGQTPLTPAIRRKKIPASAEIEPKKPRRATRETRPRWPPREEDDGDDEPTKKPAICPAGTFIRNDVAEASGGPKPKQGTKRAQWETHGDREGRVALPWLKTDPATDDGGKSCEKGVQIQNKTRRAEESGAAVKRSLPTDGAAKRPRRIATPATAVKRPSTLTSSSDGNQSKRLRARSDAGRASTNKAPSNKTGLV